MHNRYLSLVTFPIFTFALSSCGASIPDMVVLAPPMQEAFEEIELIQLIKCELHFGVQDVLDQYSKPGNTGHGVEWLRDWEAKLSLKITVDEKSALSPGVTYKEPMRNALTHFGTIVPQSFTASVGLQVSSQATRTETIGFSYKFADLLAEGRLQPDSCKKQIKNKVVVSDLKIADFIANKAYIANHTDTVINNRVELPYSTFSDDITFVITYGGNVTPVWTLLHVTASSNSPLYNAVRTKTHNLSITLGKVGAGQAAVVANANLIGQAVARAIDLRQ